MILIGLALSSIVRVEYYLDGKAWYYEISDIGMSLLTIGLISLMIIPILFSIKFIKYKKWLKIGKIISSLILFSLLILLIINIGIYYIAEYNDTLDNEAFIQMIQHAILPIILILTIILYRELIIHSYCKYILKKKGISLFHENLLVQG